MPGLTALVVGTLDQSLSKPAAAVALIAFFAGFWYWAHAREARMTSAPVRARNNRIALLAISILSVAGGVGLVWVFGPLLPMAEAHPFIAALVVIPALFGGLLIVWGLIGAVRAAKAGAPR